MSYKVLQLSPQASTEVIRTRTAVHDAGFYQPRFYEPRSGGVSSSQQIGFNPSSLQDEEDRDETGPSWISGLALAAAFSASVWSGIALIVTRILR